MYAVQTMKTDLSLVLILMLVPASLTRSLCKEEDIAEMVEEVSTDLTSKFIAEILSSGTGHSILTCDQEEWDRMVREYHQCAQHVQHQLQCGVVGGVCEWVQVFVSSCTGQVMGRCLVQEASELLQTRQLSALTSLADLTACDNPADNMVVVVKTRAGRDSPGKKQGNRLRSLLGSEFLRLG